MKPDTRLGKPRTDYPPLWWTAMVIIAFATLVVITL